MDDKTAVNVKWVNERFEDNLLRLCKNTVFDLLAMSTSVLGYEEVDELLTADDKQIKFTNYALKNRLGNPSTMSVSGTIAALSRQIGPFIIPPDIIKYMKEEVYDEQELERYLKNMPVDDSHWDLGKTYFDALIDAEFPVQSAYSLCGAFYVECAWTPNVVNVDEVADRNINVRGGWADAGEGLFGLTYWRQKESIIKKLNLGAGCEVYLWQRGRATKTVISKGITTSREKYNLGPDGGATVLAQCTEKVWMEILRVYIDSLGKGNGDDKKTIEYIMYDKQPAGSYDSEDDDHKLLYSTYLFKAGNAYKKSFDSLVKCVESYKTTHNRMYASRTPGYTAKNGFVAQLIVAWALSKYVYDGVEPEDLAPIVKKELFGY